MTKTPKPDTLRLDGVTRPILWASGVRYIAGDTEARTIYTPTDSTDPHGFIAGTYRAARILLLTIALAIAFTLGLSIPRG